MPNENEVYQLLKHHIEKLGWNVLGGEPPGGTNHIPVIELKDPENREKGSKGSKKIDLIGFKNGFFLLLELKEQYSKTDVEKLNEIVESKKWREAFLNALEDKKIITKNKLQISKSQYIDSKDFLIKSLGFTNSDKFGPDDFITFHVSKDKICIHFGKNIDEKIKKLF